TALKLARLDLEKYIGRCVILWAHQGGEYEQALSDVDGRIALAQSDREMMVDRVAYSQRMARKGYVSSSQVDADDARLRSAAFNLAKVKEERRVLTDYTLVRTRT